jgi:hypothetical protein
MLNVNLRKEKIIKDDRFGSAVAHQTLSKILNEINDDHLNRKVTSFLQSYNIILKKLSVLDTEMLIYVSLLVLNEHKEIIISSNYPDKVKSYLLNCLILKRRELIKKCKE